ncbi:GTPase [Pengzhenrongella sicca]|uniref:GTPase n=1 Tax=Pengzhenrongella sicca TaxID=2819238 RepID=UPI001D0C219C|nr:GTPase [Pengzhenrongella sicca]
MSYSPEHDVTDVAAPPAPVAPSLLDAVRDLRRDVEATSFPLDIDGVDAARASRTRLLDQLSDHLLPRLAELSAPAIVVLAGSTGAGKSTLVNSLLGTEVSEAGVLRPTTRQAVIAHHPDDGELLAGHPVLEDVKVVSHESVPRGVALLDAPDLDSVLESNRATAHRLLEAADLWLFVTTAARYGDALPWQVLAGAMERGASVAMVLNRVPVESLPAVRGDLLVRLRERGMQGVPLFVVPDAGPQQGPLSTASVAPIKRWLTMLAGPDRARAVIARTLRGSLGALRPWVDTQADAVQDQVDAADALRAAIGAALSGPTDAARAAVHRGVVADGAVTARWTELVAGAGRFAHVVRPSGRIRAARRRTTRLREASVGPLLADLQQAAVANLERAGAAAERELRERLSARGAPDGAAGFVASWPSDDRRSARATRADSIATAWIDGARLAVLAALAEGDPRALKRSARAAKALGDRALAALVLAAAAGLAPAAELLTELLGDAGDALRDQLRAELEAHAAAQVEAEGAALAALLDVPDLAADAASRLRLRFAVLRGLT